MDRDSRKALINAAGGAASLASSLLDDETDENASVFEPLIGGLLSQAQALLSAAAGGAPSPTASAHGDQRRPGRPS